MGPPKRRDRDDIALLLIEAAMVEFGAHGFDGASTVAIAKRADAHQPQINYHFSSKLELWRATVSHLFDELAQAVSELPARDDPVEQFVVGLRRYVRFCADRPELNQIIMQESTDPSDRMMWIVDTYVQPRRELLMATWSELRKLGVAAPVDEALIYHVLVAVCSAPFVAQGLEVFLGGSSEELVESHTNAVVALLLPGH